MPELPEVETVVRQLAPLVTGRHCRALLVFDPRLAEARRDDLPGRHVATVSRRGKRAVLTLEDATRPPLRLAIHLRMTGRLVWRAGAGAPARPAPHLRAVLELEGGTVEFIDARRFGTMTWIEGDAPAPDEGIEPLSPAFTAEALFGLLRRARQPLKTWLLRQDRIAGLGNIYASEILHAARLSPFRAAGSLSRAETLRLHHATVSVLEAAIRKNGTTFSDFQDAYGVTGEFQDFLKVYDRAGQPCRACGGVIRRRVQQQRSTYWCPQCLKTPLKKEKAGTRSGLDR